VKLYVTRQALHFRRAHAALFRDGAYHALEADGRHAEHLCAFARTASRGSAIIDTAPAITIVPRLLARRWGEDLPLGPEFWVDTGVTLPPEVGAAPGTRFRNVFTGETVTAEDGVHGPRLPASTVFASFPVALLERAA
jgi:(1->4)-alpha-D-glucan 1-alpha-D-glucosylmutase